MDVIGCVHTPLFFLLLVYASAHGKTHGVVKILLLFIRCNKWSSIYQTYQYEMLFSEFMVHQSILCYKDLPPRHFLVLSTTGRRTRVMNWKSVCIVLCSIVEIYTEQRAFVNRINFLFSFEENCRWIISITLRSLWWTCAIARYVWTMALAFPKWWLRGCRHGTRKTVKKFGGMQLQELLDEDDSQKKTTRRTIGR